MGNNIVNGRANSWLKAPNLSPLLFHFHSRGPMLREPSPIAVRGASRQPHGTPCQEGPQNRGLMLYGCQLEIHNNLSLRSCFVVDVPQDGAQVWSRAWGLSSGLALPLGLPHLSLVDSWPPAAPWHPELCSPSPPPVPGCCQPPEGH